MRQNEALSAVHSNSSVLLLCFPVLPVRSLRPPRLGGESIFLRKRRFRRGAESAEEKTGVFLNDLSRFQPRAEPIATATSRHAPLFLPKAEVTIVWRRQRAQFSVTT